MAAKVHQARAFMCKYFRSFGVIHLAFGVHHQLLFSQIGSERGKARRM